MAKELPETEEEMLKIPHVTKANFEKYGEALLEVTQRYSAEKLGNLIQFITKNTVDLLKMPHIIFSNMINTHCLCVAP